MKNSFIEASAGTGKTYKIMELLGEWMKSHSLDQENFLTKVLVLTFTEKAAGELKERLRKKIIDLKTNSPTPNSFSRYLMELDQVTISTFHGFCNMVLREYPIETSASAEWELGDAKERLEEILYSLKHTEWKELNISNETLNAILIGTNFFKGYEKTIIETASKILRGRDYLLEPMSESTFDFPRDKFLKELIHIKDDISDFAVWLQEEPQQNTFVKAGKTTWTENWKSIASFLLEGNTEDFSLFLGRFFRFLNFPFVNLELGLSKFIPNEKYFSTKGDKKIISEIQNRSLAHSQLIFNFATTILESIGVDAFLQKTTLFLVEKVKQKYQDSKWMSYDQMILAVRDSIYNNQNLVSILREKYQVCLLDEFQDTDLIQYEIFKRIFLEADDGNHFLYLIGDPKQSIYSFRGGDLGTYLQAKFELSDNETNPLTTNRRSVPELIKGYNRIFGIGNPESTFFPIQEIGMEGKEIHYTEVLAPDEKEQTVSLIEPFKEGPIQVVKLFEDESPASEAKKKPSKNEIQVEKINKTLATERWNQFICFEIRKLSQDRFAYKLDGNRKELRMRDIAILVKSRKDGLSVEAALRSQEIPCTYYKQEGIYQSREIDQIQNVIECLLNPNDPASYRKLLLGDLFQVNPAFLKNFDEHSIDSYEKKRLDVWRKLIRSNQYAEFFRRMEEDSRIFFTKDKKDLRWERRRTNYRQILQKLLEFQISNQSSLEELLEELKKWKIEKNNETEQPLFDKETEEDAVQILTIHASKGLEWPVVFVHGFSEMFSSPDVYDYPIKYDNGRKWSLSLWRKNISNYHESGMNEQRRLLYVALTRPQIRLYLPYCHLTKDKSPYHKFLFSSLQPIIGHPDRKFPAEEFTLRSFLELEKTKKIQKNLALSNDGLDTNVFHYSPLLHNELDFKQRLYLHSYSSLKKGIAKEISKAEDNHLLSDLEIEFPGIDSLPSSANTGLFLHSMLEEISFVTFQETEPSKIQSSEVWKTLLQNNMDKYGLLKNPEKIVGYENHAFQLINHTLKATIPLSELNYFSLCDLQDREKAEEMDFHHIFSELNLNGTLGNFLKGSIDLVIFKNQKYYIADYKSDELPKYDSPYLYNRLKENHYDLQRDIYAYVFFCYLKSLYGEKSALKLFGGVYYLFLRGMKENTSDGVYADLGLSEEGSWNAERFSTIKKTVEDQILKTLYEAK